MAARNGKTFVDRNSGRQTPSPPHTATADLPASGDKHREGYDVDLFVPAADSKYICPICTMVCRNPMQTLCGHRFCDYCIRKWIRMQSKCPVDNAVLDESKLFPDKIASREIMGLTVHCFNYRLECSHVAEMSNMQAHLKTCDYESIQCKNGCGQQVQRRLLEEHQRTGCATKCKLCFKIIPIALREKHMAECDMNDFRCSACGAAGIIVKNREQHARVDCPKAEARCQLYAFGCRGKLLREQVADHNKDRLADHVAMLASYIQGQAPPPRHLTSSPSKGGGGGAKGLAEDVVHSVDDTCNKFPLSFPDPPPPPRNYSLPLPTTNSDSGIESFAEITRGQNAKLAKQSQHVFELQAKVQHLEKKVKEQNVTIRQQHDLITDLETRCSKGLYYWKITEYARRSQEARMGTTTVLHSPGFYSSFHGYKMCLRVNLNGVETGHGTHLSLFVHLMRGDFDDILVWPFTGKITLSIIDQSEDKKHIVETLEGNESIAAFHRPTSSRNHKGFGYMEFVPLSRIEGKLFVKNDTLIIRCQVQEPS